MDTRVHRGYTQTDLPIKVKVEAIFKQEMDDQASNKLTGWLDYYLRALLCVASAECLYNSALTAEQVITTIASESDPLTNRNCIMVAEMFAQLLNYPHLLIDAAEERKRRILASRAAAKVLLQLGDFVALPASSKLKVA